MKVILCGRCKRTCHKVNVLRAGVRAQANGSVRFSYTFRCSNCKGQNTITNTSRSFSQPQWWLELAEWDEAQAIQSVARRTSSHGDTHLADQSNLPVDISDAVAGQEYFATVVRLLDCVAANFDHAKGDKALSLTIGRKQSVEPLAFPIADAKQLVTKALIALAVFDDKFARRLLDDHFSGDSDGNFIWPRSDPEPS